MFSTFKAANEHHDLLKNQDGKANDSIVNSEDEEVSDSNDNAPIKNHMLTNASAKKAKASAKTNKASAKETKASDKDYNVSAKKINAFAKATKASAYLATVVANTSDESYEEENADQSSGIFLYYFSIYTFDTDLVWRMQLTSI